MWSAIVKQVDSAGSESAFVSVADTPRTTFAKHPWSIGGGGAADLLENLSSPKTKQLESLTTAIGRITHTGADEVYFSDKRTWQRKFGDTAKYYPLVEGDVIRDWNLEPETWILFPYNQELQAYLDETGLMAKYLWIYKQFLVRRRELGGTHEEVGLTWYEWSRFQRERFRVPLGITFAFVATHNHFVLDRGGKVFKQSAPVIKLPAGATEDEHLALLGLLNSSVACFWLKQVCHNKGSTVDQHGARQTTTPFEDFYEFTGTKLAEFPLAEPVPTDIARRLDQLAQQRAECLPANVIALVPKLPLGNAVRETPASQADKQSLQAVGSQAGAWEPAKNKPNINRWLPCPAT